MTSHSSNIRLDLKNRLLNRERMFAGWVSFAHPSITETLVKAGFDFMLIDMEHSTISIEQAQRIIAASQAHDVPCLPRPVSHNNDYLKPLLESGADGLLIQMVEHPHQVATLVDLCKYPPVGNRTYGVNRAQAYGFEFDSYIAEWNDSLSLLLQIESQKGVLNIDELLAFDEVDGVMIGPLDLSGSLGVPGQVNHPSVLEATQVVIQSCQKFGKSCGTQVSNANIESVSFLFEQGYTFAILGSDLFALYNWSLQMQQLIKSY